MKDYLPSLSLKHAKNDISSGIVVFLVAIPLCLGIATASGVPPLAGIIAGLLGGIVVGLWGGSALGVSGPAAGLVAVIIQARKDFALQFGDDPAEVLKNPEFATEVFQILLLATLIGGVIQLLLGMVRAGTIAYYFPTTVIKGMLAAIGAIIILKQIPHAFGDDRDYGGDLKFWQEDGENTFTELWAMLQNFQMGALIICCVGLAILVLWGLPFIKNRNWSRIISGPLVVVVVGVLMQLGFERFFPGLAIQALDGYSPMVDLPADQSPAEWVVLPAFSAIGSGKVWLYAAIIAGVASIESLLCAEATDKLDPQKRITPINKELRAQGLANIASGFIGGLPITQVIVRSSANVQSGGQTRFAAFFHGILILIAVILLPNLLNMIPLASLAAILIMVGLKLLRPSLFKTIYKRGMSQFIPFIVTIVAIMVTDLLVGIAIGTAVSGIFILINNFQVPYTFEIGEKDGRPYVRLILSEIVSFLNKGNILATLREVPDGAHLIIDASRTFRIDPDVKEVIDDFHENADHRGITFEWIQSEHQGQNPGNAKQLRKMMRNDQGKDGANPNPHVPPAEVPAPG